MTDPHGEVRTYPELLARYELERSDPKWKPIMLGFRTIDTELRGISPGQVLGIAARTAVGKTWLLESIEHNFAGRRDAGQLSLSLEMPGGEWAERALAIHADVSPEQVEQWAIRRELAEHAAPFLDRMANSLVCETAVALNAIPSRLEEARDMLDVPIRVLHVDYLGLLGAPGNNAYERASLVGRELKAIAKAEEVAVIVAMQVSRAGGNGGDPVTREMLRDSGVLEESLDFLLGCWRPGLAIPQERRQAMVAEEIAEEDDKMTVAILKNRKGKQGRWVDLVFRPNSRRLVEVADPFSHLTDTGGMR